MTGIGQRTLLVYLRKGVLLQVSLLSLCLSVLNCKLFFRLSFAIFLVSVKRFRALWDHAPTEWGGEGEEHEAVLSACEGPLVPGTGAGDIMKLVNFKSSSFYFFFFFLWYILQKPTLGREGPVASLLHCRRATLAFQSIYYEIKWIPLGLIPCCNCNEKKQFLTLHLRSITIKIH